MMGMRNGVAAGLLCALSLVAATGGPASATTDYDGVWSVVISSRDALCSGAYRYPVAIVDGNVRRAERGNQAFSVRGRVEADGRVKVEVGSGDLRAYGTGRLSQSAGSGTWRSPSGCAGRWQAARRG